jgi:hypothetical protein
MPRDNSLSLPPFEGHSKVSTPGTPKIHVHASERPSNDIGEPMMDNEWYVMVFTHATLPDVEEDVLFYAGVLMRPDNYDDLIAQRYKHSTSKKPLTPPDKDKPDIRARLKGDPTAVIPRKPAPEKPELI